MHSKLTFYGQVGSVLHVLIIQGYIGISSIFFFNSNVLAKKFETCLMSESNYFDGKGQTISKRNYLETPLPRTARNPSKISLAFWSMELQKKLLLRMPDL